ncbi:MAG: purine-binding chemotaxis protein CheW [Mariprofundaceae bacterium]|nr:purine-binding chemotaxis protein CheW [Mariprofundaceae bacterium]
MDIATHNKDAENQYLTFMLAGEEYGVDILTVQELRGWEDTTPIPNTPDFVLGVINLRGVVVPIVSLRERFELEAAAHGPTTVVIIVKVAGGDKDRVLGIVVDAVSEVYDISGDDLQPPPDMQGAISIDFITGLAMIDEKMVILLDINKLINEGVLSGNHNNEANHDNNTLQAEA